MPDDLDFHAERLENALTGAVIRALRRQESIAVATSGGLDSSVLAALASRHFDENVQLVCAGTRGSADTQDARRLARHLGCPLVEIALTRARVRRLLPGLVEAAGRVPAPEPLRQEWNLPEGSTLLPTLRITWEVPIAAAFAEASLHAQRVLLGQGADELLAGYARYETLEPSALEAESERDLADVETHGLALEAKLAARVGVRPMYPFLDPVVKALCRALPFEAKLGAGVNKRVLRAVAARLDLPHEIVTAPKRAAQYGSGATQLLRQMAEAAQRPLHSYLEDFAPTGSPASPTPSERSA